MKTETKSPVRRFHLASLITVIVAAGALVLGAACNTTPTSTSPLSATDTENLAGTAPSQVTRDIEEADIIKIVGDKLYALNRYKGLLIIDVSNPDAPALLGTLDLRGRGIEMYVIGQRVYAVLSADYIAYGGWEGGGMAPGGPNNASLIAPGPQPPDPDFEGSQLAIIDVTNPGATSVINKVNLAGYASDSRRVGDIIYVVGANGFPYYLRSDGEGSDDEGFVASVNVADPNNVLPVERKTFAGDSLAIHVSDRLILAASRKYDSSAGATNTEVQVIDISDPAGAIVIRGKVQVPGTIRNRFFMDDDQDVMRIVTQSSGFGFRTVRLFTYSLADLDNIAAIASLQINQGETAEAVRFDGPRGYVVTFLRVDPLFVIDLNDPANPTVSGQLKVPGYSTHIEPRGDRLFAVGIDDTDGSRPAVAYYNVADPANPSELARVVLGPPGSYTESEATYDEKAFKIVDDLGLIAIPFSHVEYPEGPVPPQPVPMASENSINRPKCVNAVQLVDFSDTALTQRGWFEHKGRVERVGAIGGRVFGLSQSSFQTVNIADRDHPVKAGEVEFFTADEKALYGDECGYVYWPTVMPDPDMTQLLALLSNLCGTAGTASLAMTFAGLLMMRGATRRRRRSDGP